jgi:hypothetical protein
MPKATPSKAELPKAPPKVRETKDASLFALRKALCLAARRATPKASAGGFRRPKLSAGDPLRSCAAGFLGTSNLKLLCAAGSLEP